MQQLLLFHWLNGCTNASQYIVCLVNSSHH